MRLPLSTTAVELLVAGRALIEAGWCTGSSARDAKGLVTPFGGPKACSFCMSGALCHLMNFIERAHQTAVKALQQAIGTTQIAAWNDAFGRTKEEVLLAYDQAIEIAKQWELDSAA
jgi:glycine/D-amino acid oxidase-like deaminating enzyme